jgi:hypothetical protein
VVEGAGWMDDVEIGLGARLANASDLTARASQRLFPCPRRRRRRRDACLPFAFLSYARSPV